MSLSKKRLFVALLSVACLSSAAAVQADQTFDFNTPVVTGATQAPGVWYTDRYAPAGFSSPVFFDNDNRLLQSISAADSADSRPPAYSSAFYNTQGRKYDLEAGTVKMSIDLYIPAAWETTGARMAGFWGTAVDALNAVTAYPIVEFTSDTATPRFRVWDNGIWADMGLPTGFAYDAWQTLGIESLPSGEFKYTVGDLTATAGVGDIGSVEIDNVILQGHNSQTGVTYDIHWDNLTTSVVPEPASAALAGCAALGLFVVRRRRS
jgi:hypothetical protein